MTIQCFRCAVPALNWKPQEDWFDRCIKCWMRYMKEYPDDPNREQAAERIKEYLTEHPEEGLEI